MKRILVTGGNGQLATVLKLARQYSEHSFSFIDRSTLDLTSFDQVKSYLENNPFDYIVNCAAFTAVDLAEEQMGLAYKVNEEVVEILAHEANRQDATLIHISTDFVFPGNLNRPLSESDPTAPLSVYGKSKLAGEKAVKTHCQKHFVIRTSWLYSALGKNFLKTILRLSETKDKLGIVYDQVGTPTYAPDLAEAILTVVESDSQAYGIYHFSNEGVCSWYDFAVEIKHQFNLKMEISPILTEEYPLPANRPDYSVMSKNKLKKEFGVSIPHWREGLVRCHKALGNG